MPATDTLHAAAAPIGCDSYASQLYAPTNGNLRCEAWVARYNDPVEDYDGPVRGAPALATSADGRVLFTAGTSAMDGNTEDLDAILLASDAETGQQLWVGRYEGEGSDKPRAQAYSLKVDPSGRAVYVLAQAAPVSAGLAESSILAFDLSTGALLWQAPLIAPWGERTQLSSIDVAGDGTRVYATGNTVFFDASGKRFTYGITAAFEAAAPEHLGEQLWATPHAAANGSFARHISVSPDGSRVFVAGSILLANGRRDGFTTVAYGAEDGGELWQRHEPGAFPNDLGIPAAAGLVVSPDGTRVFVTAADQLADQGADSFHVIVVFAYDSATGKRAWASKLGGAYPTGGDGTRTGLFIEVGTPIGVSPDSSAVYVAGTLSEITSAGAPLRYALLTAALDADTGVQLWRNEFDEGRPRRTFWPYLPALVVSDDGVYVTATRSVEVVVPFVTAQYEDEYHTLGLDAATGATEWVGRWGEGRSHTAGIAMTPDGRRLFVTGDSLGLTERNEGSWDLVTVAYDTTAMTASNNAPHGPAAADLHVTDGPTSR